MLLLFFKHTLLPVNFIGINLLSQKLDLALTMVDDILHDSIVALDQLASFNLVTLSFVDHLAYFLDRKFFA